MIKTVRTIDCLPEYVVQQYYSKSKVDNPIKSIKIINMFNIFLSLDLNYNIV